MSSASSAERAPKLAGCCPSAEGRRWGGCGAAGVCGWARMCGEGTGADATFPEPLDQDVCPEAKVSEPDPAPQFSSVFGSNLGEALGDASLAAMESASWAKSHGLMEAPGVLGSAYYGQIDLETGVLNGFGRWTSQETMVEGMWRQGKMHGFAKQIWPDGRTYEGEFRDGLFWGTGIMTWQHARGTSVYEGEYENDKKHGVGKFTWPSGRSYEGQWVSGRRQGVGVETTSSGKSRGRWSDDMLVEPLPPSP